MKTKVKLKIADVVINMDSDFQLETFTPEEVLYHVTERFTDFYYEGNDKPHIIINVQVVERLPRIVNAEPIFTTYHFQDGSENWRLVKKGSEYIFKCPLDDKKQTIFVNETFDRATAYLHPKKGKGKVWNPMDLIYDFLQVLLIHHLALRKTGIFTHSVGIKDVDGNGFLFNGKSGAGKSTTAQLWHNHAKAIILNDDRVIVRKHDDEFFIHGSPWHGDFNDYLHSMKDGAPLKKIFFIYHSSNNKAKQAAQKEAFYQLYPAIFPTFWDKKCLENTAALAEDLIANVPCYNLGFVNNEEIIDFVREI